MVSTNRQSVGHETIWQPQGLSQRKNTSEDFRTLGYSPMQFIQVLLGPLYAFIISSKSYYPASRNIILQR
ncbi:hypothetical protein FF38_08668 [Lucilia cuprina]|uniref:Uncharacterized protein n=1 Tax=Lucilia cuprina TaxID=7375 RepID=A0A0L0CB75_LUCCU|nr:hypothetical protein FF38_08668 [Lucilia cuprina]